MHLKDIENTDLIGLSLVQVKTKFCLAEDTNRILFNIWDRRVLGICNCCHTIQKSSDLKSVGSVENACIGCLDDAIHTNLEEQKIIVPA